MLDEITGLLRLLVAVSSVIVLTIVATTGVAIAVLKFLLSRNASGLVVKRDATPEGSTTSISWQQPEPELPDELVAYIQQDSEDWAVASRVARARELYRIYGNWPAVVREFEAEDN